ncbi:MAG TPA: hypothetical protein VGX23_05890 [Actinocrinis sp.]|nr:hypothetical protein [Actinocrinis sp.]
MTTLEQRYQKLIGYLPKDYREARAEEILTTLMDDAEPGRRRPKAADVLSVGSLAIRLRFGAPGANARGRLTGDIARKTIIANLVLQSAISAYVPVLLVTEFSPVLSKVALPLWFSSVSCVLEAALAVALVLGRLRTGRVLSVVTLLAVATDMGYGAYLTNFMVAHLGIFATYGLTAVAWILQSFTVLVVFPAFHRNAPRLEGRHWWFLLSAPLFAYGLALGHYSYYVYVAAGAIAVAVAVARAGSSSAWPLAFLLSSWPLLLTGIGLTIDQAYYYGPQSGLGVTVSFSVLGVLLCLALASVTVRRRRVLA